MSSPDQPPPYQTGKQRRKFVPRFNTAMLLGAMALVAVVCAVAMTVPTLFALLIGLLARAVIVGFGAVMLAGAFDSFPGRRLFCSAALVSLLLLQFVGHGLNTGWMSWQLQNNPGSGWAMYLFYFLGLVERIVLSLFGGWVAVRAARFWKGESSQDPPPTEVGG